MINRLKNFAESVRDVYLEQPVRAAGTTLLAGVALVGLVEIGFMAKEAVDPGRVTISASDSPVQKVAGNTINGMLQVADNFNTNLATVPAIAVIDLIAVGVAADSAKTLRDNSRKS